MYVRYLWLLSTTLLSVASQDCSGIKRDLIILLDSSSSVGKENFEKAKMFLVNFISELDDTGYQVGMIRFSDSLGLISSLESVRDKKTLLTEKVRNIDYHGGGTATGKALEAALNVGFKRNNRKDAPDQIMTLTDGMSDTPEKTAAQVKAARAMNVELISVGVGPDIDQKELLSLASNENLMFEVNSFDDLNSIKSQLVASSCGVTTLPTTRQTTTTSTSTTASTTTSTSSTSSTTTPTTKTSTTTPTPTKSSTPDVTNSKISNSNDSVADANMAESETIADDSKYEGAMSSMTRGWKKVVGVSVGVFALVGLTTGLVVLIVMKIQMKKQKRRYLETL